MTLTLIQAIALGAGVITLWSSILLLAINRMLDRDRKHSDDGFTGIGRAVGELKDLQAKASTRTDDLEKALLKLQVEFATDYVRREDWIRFGTTIAAKIDAFWSRFDTLPCRPHPPASPAGRPDMGPGPLPCDPS